MAKIALLPVTVCPFKMTVEAEPRAVVGAVAETSLRIFFLWSSPEY